ncbi:MAG: GNAT family N-acetyltransferase [Bacteroidales bacterium]|nr:GNAT family N-acetyltransferase [Bacteroidales bacterium]
MNFVSIIEDNSSESRQLYERAFVEDERRYWQQIKANIKKEKFNFFTIKDKESFIGIISLWNFDCFMYIEHFAILESLRSKGFGSKVLEMVSKEYSLPLVLEVDVPDDETSIKRVKFYEKNGFTMFSNKYVQPPYDKGKASVEMRIMSSDKSLEFSLIKDTLYEKVYGVTR